MSNQVQSKTAEILMEDLRKVTDPKLRTATMSAIYGVAMERTGFTFDSVLKRVEYAGEEQGKAHVRSALLSLKDLGVLHRNEQDQVDFTPALEDRFVDIMADFASREEANYAPTHEPHQWDSPKMGLKKLCPGAHPEMLEHMAYDKMPRVYNALNKMQRVGFRIDETLLQITGLQNYLYKKARDTGDLTPMREFGEYTRMHKEGGDWYFTQTLDTRSRMYYRGILNPSNLGDFGKAAFRYAEAKPVNQKAYKALALHYSETAGIKGSLNKRIKWAKKDGLVLAAKLHGKDVKAIQYLTGEDKPFMVYTASQEFLRVTQELRAGKKVYSDFICRQDGKCNGIQHGAMLTRCSETAHHVSLAPMSWDDTPGDIYWTFREILVATSPTASIHDKVLTRSVCKPPVMVCGYGAGKSAICRDMAKVIAQEENEGHEAVLRALQEEDSVFAEEIMDVLGQVAGGMVRVTHALREAVAPLADTAQSVHWITEDGWPVRQEGRVLIDECYDTLNLEPVRYDEHEAQCNKRWQVRNDMPEVIDYDRSASQTIKGIAPNFVHSIDATHVRHTVERSYASIVHTHDDIGSHACDYFEVNMQLRESFIEVHQFDWFGGLKEWSGVEVSLEQGDFDHNHVREATYFFS